MDSATKESPKRKRNESLSLSNPNKRLDFSDDVSTPEKNKEMEIEHYQTPTFPYSDHASPYPTIFRATPNNVSTKSQPPSERTHIYKRPSLDNKSQISPHVHSGVAVDNDDGDDDDDDDVIVIKNLTPKKHYDKNSSTPNSKIRGGRISEAYKMKQRQPISRRMLMPEDYGEGEGEGEEKENDDHVEGMLM